MKRFTTTLLLSVFCIMLVGCGKSKEEKLYDKALQDSERLMDKAMKNAERMMTSAESLREGIEITFADGCRGLVPFEQISEVDGGGDLVSIELPNPYEAILHTESGKTVELPWDFVRHYCDSSYQKRIEGVGVVGRQAIGDKIRQLRESSGLTQQTLATLADIGRVTLVRIENGGQSPRYETLASLARALARPLSDLVAASE